MENEIIYVPLNKLTISRKNVRVVSARKEDDRELMSSILSQGVLQNLVVEKTEKGLFEVCAGGRRYAALQALSKQGEIKKNYPVPCKLTDAQNATAASITENIRAPMHPADEFVAYHKLAKQGKTPKDIAREFGKPLAEVKRLLKLASVSPKMIDEFRAGKLDLDDIMAFTLCEDHEKQLACYNHFNRRHIYPHAIREYLTEDSMRSDDPMAKLVGLAAYKKAGGRISQDLFNSLSYLHDRDIIKTLASEMLEKEIKACLEDGWKWAEISQDNSIRFYSNRLKPKATNVPEALANKHKDIKARLDEIQSKMFDSDSEEVDYELESELEEQLEDLEDEMDQYREYTSRQKARAGCYITVNHKGKIEVFSGYVRKEDQRKTSKKNGKTPGDADGSPFPESKALQHELDHYYAQAFQVELMKHPQEAFDILVFTLATDAIDQTIDYDPMADIRLTQKTLTARGIDETTAHHNKAELFESLNTSWSVNENQKERFKAFCELTTTEKMALMAYAVGLSFDASINKDADSAVHDVANRCQFNVGNYWAPTEENYFSRITRGILLGIGEAVIGKDWVAENEKQKKGTLSETLAQHQKMKGWLPEFLRQTQDTISLSQ